MKKRLMLGIIAAALTLALVVGGTLMLFTAQTETATNVVTTGNVQIILQEQGGEIIRDVDGEEIRIRTKGWRYDYKTVGEDGFTGIDYDDPAQAVPGDTLTKSPRIVNSGLNPVYVKVTGVLKVNIAGKEDILNYLYTGDFVDIINTNANVVPDDKGWVLDEAAVSRELVGEEVWITGTWYYVDNSGAAARLSVVQAGQGTVPVFDSFTFPTAWDNLFNFVTFKLDVTGYAVQAANNAPLTQDLAGWKAIGWPA